MTPNEVNDCVSCVIILKREIVSDYEMQTKSKKYFPNYILLSINNK